MRQKNSTPLIALAVALACGATGCQGKMQQRQAFPATWPSGLVWSQPTQASIAPAEVAGPAVAVQLLTMEAEDAQRPPTDSSNSTSRMLTNLMVEKLRQAGVRVSDSDAEYTFGGTISKLGYTQRGGYPRKLYYTSELVYQLVHRPSGTVVWKGNLSQDFEQTVLVNTMTKLPSDPNAPETVLLEKCISPNWGIIAADVKAFLKKSPPASEK